MKSLRVIEPVEMLFDDNRIILGLNESAYTPALTLSAVPSNKFGGVIY